MRVTVENELTLDVEDGTRVTISNEGNGVIVITLETTPPLIQKWESPRFIDSMKFIGDNNNG